MIRDTRLMLYDEYFFFFKKMLLKTNDLCIGENQFLRQTNLAIYLRRRTVEKTRSAKKSSPH